MLEKHLKQKSEAILRILLERTRSLQGSSGKTALLAALRDLLKKKDADSQMQIVNAD